MTEAPVHVTVPRVASIDSTGRVTNARTNTGEHPHTDDLIYVRVRNGYEVADSEMVARIAAADWQAVSAPGECRPTHGLGRTPPVRSTR